MTSIKIFNLKVQFFGFGFVVVFVFSLFFDRLVTDYVMNAILNVPLNFSLN